MDREELERLGRQIARRVYFAGFLGFGVGLLIGLFIGGIL